MRDTTLGLKTSLLSKRNSERIRPNIESIQVYLNGKLWHGGTARTQSIRVITKFNIGSYAGASFLFLMPSVYYEAYSDIIDIDLA